MEIMISTPCRSKPDWLMYFENYTRWDDDTFIHPLNSCQQHVDGGDTRFFFSNAFTFFVLNQFCTVQRDEQYGVQVILSEIDPFFYQSSQNICLLRSLFPQLSKGQIWLELLLQRRFESQIQSNLRHKTCKNWQIFCRHVYGLIDEIINHSHKK